MRAVLAQLRIELVLALRRGENLLVTLVVPIILLVFFGALAISPTDYLVPGILALAVMSTSMVSLGIQTAYERYYGALKRLLGSPLPVASLLLAKALSVLIFEVVQIALLVGIASVTLNWQPAGDPLLAAAALALGSLAFAGLGLLMAGTLRAEATLALANGLYLVFLLLGGFVLPLNRLPPAVAAIASVLPAAALSEATRAAVTDSGQGALGPLALLAAWAVVGIGAAVLTFRSE